MQKTKSVTIEGRDNVTVKELTVAEIRDLLEAAEGKGESKEPPGILDLLFNEGLSGEAVAVSSGISVDDLLSWTPSDLEVLRAAVVEVNPTFLGLWSRLVNLGRKLMQQPADEAKSKP